MSIPSFRPRGAASISVSLAGILVTAFAVVGCGSTAAPNFNSGIGGPVTGDLDMHCSGVDPIVTSPASCPADAGAPADNDAAAPDDGGAVEPPAPPVFNAEADDDDCKYHVKFKMTAAKLNGNVTFQVTVTRLSDGKPATGAAVYIESFVEANDTHVVPNNGTGTTEAAGTGIYTIAPVKFDVAGRWVVRFHIFGQCADLLEDSPHGHVAFLADVVP